MYLVEWRADGAEQSKGDECRLDANEAKTLEQAWQVADRSEQQELREQVELDDDQVLQRVPQLPVPCRRFSSDPQILVELGSWQR